VIIAKASENKTATGEETGALPQKKAAAKSAGKASSGTGRKSAGETGKRTEKGAGSHGGNKRPVQQTASGGKGTILGAIRDFFDL
jgi:hypothetical protein